jgi:hypothetical protein
VLVSGVQPGQAAAAAGLQPGDRLMRLDGQPLSGGQSGVAALVERIKAAPEQTLRLDAERNGQTAWYTREGIAFYGAAGPALRELRPHRYLNRYRILLTSERTGRTVLVWVVDWCSCQGTGSPRLIDLAPAVWDALGVPLSRGITPVTIEFLD